MLGPVRHIFRKREATVHHAERDVYNGQKLSFSRWISSRKLENGTREVLIPDVERNGCLFLLPCWRAAAVAMPACWSVMRRACSSIAASDRGNSPTAYGPS